MANDRHRQATERQLGAHEGEAFDCRLRDREGIERTERLSRIAWDHAGQGPSPEDPPDPGYRPSLDALHLQREVERLSAYYHAVQNSRPWRLTQRLRRLVGRAW